MHLPLARVACSTLVHRPTLGRRVLSMLSRCCRVRKFVVRRDRRQLGRRKPGELILDHLPKPVLCEKKVVWELGLTKLWLDAERASLFKLDHKRKEALCKWICANCSEEIKLETVEGVTALSQEDYIDIRNRRGLDSWKEGTSTGSGMHNPNMKSSPFAYRGFLRGFESAARQLPRRRFAFAVSHSAVGIRRGWGPR